MKRIEKILEYLTTQGITYAEFEKQANLGNGYLKGTLKRNQDISNKIFERIRTQVPDLFQKIFEEKIPDYSRPTKKPEEDRDPKEELIETQKELILSLQREIARDAEWREMLEEMKQALQALAERLLAHESPAEEWVAPVLEKVPLAVKAAEREPEPLPPTETLAEPKAPKKRAPKKARPKKAKPKEKKENA